MCSGMPGCNRRIWIKNYFMKLNESETISSCNIESDIQKQKSIELIELQIFLYIGKEKEKYKPSMGNANIAPAPVDYRVEKCIKNYQSRQ